MPMDKRLYPANWNQIAGQVKQAANWTCEDCGRVCWRPGDSLETFLTRIQTTRRSECPVVAEFSQYPRRFVLTVAHLDHRPEHCDRDNLRALCAPCHCRMDLKAMPLKKQLKAERLGQLRLEGL